MENIVIVAKAFSDINRVKILALLIENNELCVCEICDTLELSQPLVSRHLKQMKEAGILVSRQNKKWMMYSLVKKPYPLVESFLSEIKKSIYDLPALVVCNKK